MTLRAICASTHTCHIIQRVCITRLKWHPLTWRALPGGSFARAGAPWEFNLRDIMRWCDLSLSAIGNEDVDAAAEAEAEDADAEAGAEAGMDISTAVDAKRFSAAERAVDVTFGTLFAQRLRTPADRAECSRLFEGAFGRPPAPRPPPAISLKNGRAWRMLYPRLYMNPRHMGH